MTWNYQEAGHGKSAPDGVGVVVKRTADNHVKFSGNVGCFEDFVNLIRETVQTVEVMVITEKEINQKKFPNYVPTFKGHLDGTMVSKESIPSSLVPTSASHENKI